MNKKSTKNDKNKHFIFFASSVFVSVCEKIHLIFFLRIYEKKPFNSSHQLAYQILFYNFLVILCFTCEIYATYYILCQRKISVKFFLNKKLKCHNFKLHCRTRVYQGFNNLGHVWHSR